MEFLYAPFRFWPKRSSCKFNLEMVLLAANTIASFSKLLLTAAVRHYGGKAAQHKALSTFINEDSTIENCIACCNNRNVCKQAFIIVKALELEEDVLWRWFGERVQKIKASQKNETIFTTELASDVENLSSLFSNRIRNAKFILYANVFNFFDNAKRSKTATARGRGYFHTFEL